MSCVNVRLLFLLSSCFCSFLISYVLFVVLWCYCIVGLLYAIVCVMVVLCVFVAFFFVACLSWQFLSFVRLCSFLVSYGTSRALSRHAFVLFHVSFLYFLLIVLLSVVMKFYRALCRDLILVD